MPLDGSGSSDPDEDDLTFTWTGPFPEGGGKVHGVSPIVTLPLGTSTVALVVNDGQVDSVPDTVDITVEDTRDWGLFGFAAALALGVGVAVIMQRIFLRHWREKGQSIQ